MPLAVNVLGHLFVAGGATRANRFRISARKTADLRGIPRRLNMVRSGAMTSFASTFGRTLILQRLGMRGFRKAREGVFVAHLAGFAADTLRGVPVGWRFRRLLRKKRRRYLQQ